ncbi:MAG: TIGR04283 family arsenosugar biosynthesis glycosyltransferase, partial [Gammaproteobacteria bacterium]|nr:TIGR04283 family arsenosugar biosynthesis glycosyltransferase [Gammaproteobacteria bacterium]
HELILVDGGSSDTTISLSKPLVDQDLTSKSGRARQMNRGAAVAENEVLLFLHADTQLPADTVQQIDVVLKGYMKVWGRFDVTLSGENFMFRVIERMINLRSCLTGVATGDQAIFVRRAVFEQFGGYAQIPLMEDVALSKTLRSISRPCCIKSPVVTSSRRWEEHGIFKTIGLMWWLRFQYFIGIDPSKLANSYRYKD